MRGVALNRSPSPSTAALFYPARPNVYLNHIHPMKTLDTVLAVIAWIILAIVLFALSPLLIRLIEMANHLNHYFGN